MCRAGTMQMSPRMLVARWPRDHDDVDDVGSDGNDGDDKDL